MRLDASCVHFWSSFNTCISHRMANIVEDETVRQRVKKTRKNVRNIHNRLFAHFNFSFSRFFSFSSRSIVTWVFFLYLCLSGDAIATRSWCDAFFQLSWKKKLFVAMSTLFDEVLQIYECINTLFFHFKL